MTEKIDSQLFENRLHLNIIINLITRVNKILKSLTSSWIYEQNESFWLLDWLYRQIILKLIEFKDIININTENRELIDIIIDSELFNFNNLHCYDNYSSIYATEELLEWMLWPILRKVEEMSVRNEINNWMYYLNQFSLDLEKVKLKLIEDLEWKEGVVKDLLTIILNEIEFDILVNSTIEKFTKKNKILYDILINKKPIYFINDDVIFNTNIYVFKNIFNDKEYSINNHWNYDKLINILLKYHWKYVPYKKIEEESWMELFKTNAYKLWKYKKITDMKCNLVSNIEKNIGINKWTLNFIEVSNWLKISFK